MSKTKIEYSILVGIPKQVTYMCRILYFHSDVPEDTVFVGCDAVYFPTF
jgi:hypothetical protein